MDALVIAFVSGKGGTGKSTTSVLVGGALAALGKSVLLVELDSGLRSVDVIAGVSGQTVFDIEDVLSGRCEPNRAIVQSSVYNGLSVISAPYAGGVITTKGLRVLCNKMRSHFDYILIDTAAGLGAPYQAAVAVANRVVLVLTPDPVALRDGRLITDELDTPGDGAVRLILNRVNPAQISAEGILRDLDEAIDIVGARLLGVIPESPAILKAAVTGTPLPANKLEKKVYDAIAYRITGHDVPLLMR